MKLIIAGSRTINPGSSFLKGCICDFGIDVTEIVSGTAYGVDKAGEKLTNSLDTDLLSLKLKGKLAKFPANWDKHGKSAGHIRNAEMAKYGDALLLIWDGSSRGSANMKQNMEKLGKPVYEVIIKVPKIVEDEL